MKITRIRKARNYRIFRDFAWPGTGLPDFSRFNVIYGWNGTGKTSISNIFRHLQTKAPLTDGDVEIQIDESRAAGADFGKAAIPPVRVFNRDTVDRNVFEVGGQQFPPVFYLGEDSVEKQKLIEGLKKQQAGHVEKESRFKRAKAEASTALESFAAEESKGIKNLLTVSGGGIYNNYNAANFKTAIKKLADSAPSPQALTDKQRKQYLATKEGKAMDKVSDPSIRFPDFADLTTRTQTMLERSLVSATIAELVENPAVSRWVNSGLYLHTEAQQSGNCLFCAQPLPPARIARLEAHFNDEFKRFQSDLDSLIIEVETACEFRDRLQVPPKEALYSELRDEYQTARDSLSQSASTFRLSLEVLLRGLKAKREDPFKRLELSRFMTGDGSADYPVGKVEKFFQAAMAGVAIFSAVVGNTSFDKLTGIIRRHNSHTDTFDAKMKEARAALAQNELVRALPGWREKSKQVGDAGEKATKERESADKLTKEITQLEREIRQHRRPADELNVEVASYLGRDELRFHVEQNGYRITRGGQPATHLSDGERTAIAFLYFLKSLKGADFDLANGVVVIDDPVSSLDANSLFSAFGFMKERTHTAGQLFVLTHNFTFFRQVRNWYYNLEGQNKKEIEGRPRPARFYMLTGEFINGQRTARLSELDPFLHKYESEYHYLFKRVHEEANKASAPGIEAYYAMPNIARRLLESFLAFRVPDKVGELYQKLQGVEYDSNKKTRILRFLHTYSHFDQVAQPEHDLSVLAETPAVLREVLDFIRHCDPGHFTSMTALATQQTDE